MKTILISIAISTLLFIVFTVIFYNIVVYFYPPITEDGHRYMPISQIVRSIFMSLALSVICFIFCVKKLKKRLFKKK